MRKCRVTVDGNPEWCYEYQSPNELCDKLMALGTLFLNDWTHGTAYQIQVWNVLTEKWE